MPPPLVDADPTGDGPEYQSLRASAEHLDGIIDRLENFVSHPRTSLVGDDAATALDVFSFQIRGLLSTATDNLRGVALMVVDADALPVFAGYTLLRNALECAGLSLWLLGPRSRNERVIRSLQLSYESKRDDRVLSSEFDGTPHIPLEPGDDEYDRLLALRDARPALSTRSLRPPSITNRLTAAQTFVTSPGPAHALVTYWRLASGVTHGRRDVIWRVTDARIESWTELGAVTVMTADIALLTETFDAALSYLETALNLLETRNTPR